MIIILMIINGYIFYGLIFKRIPCMKNLPSVIEIKDKVKNVKSRGRKNE